jgi:ArsR family transcriptional regulator
MQAFDAGIGRPSPNLSSAETICPVEPLVRNVTNYRKRFEAMQEKIPNEILLLMAEKFRMLSDPTRLVILRTLMTEGELNVSRIVKHTDGTQANVSKHLKQLAEAGLVARRKDGPQVLYRLDDPVVEKICHLVCETILKDLEDQMEQHRKLFKQ